MVRLTVLPLSIFEVNILSIPNHERQLGTQIYIVKARCVTTKKARKDGCLPAPCACRQKENNDNERSRNNDNISLFYFHHFVVECRRNEIYIELFRSSIYDLNFIKFLRKFR